MTKFASITTNTPVTIVTTKAGAQRGRGIDRKWLGRHKVAVKILVGASYRKLVEDSLIAVNSEGFRTLIKGKVAGLSVGKNNNSVTDADIEAGLASLAESFNKTLNGENSHPSQASYEAYELDGQKVKGVKVYTSSDPNGRGNVGDIHISGVFQDTVTLEEDPNGSLPKSKARNGESLVKKLARRNLPVGSWVQYRLKAGADWQLTVGSEAERAFDTLKN